MNEIFSILISSFIYFLQIASNDIETHNSASVSTPNSSKCRKVSSVLVYYTKNGNGNYSCNIFKQSNPSRELIIKRDKTESTMSLWKHLEKCHLPIYMDL